jgi:hypothetical protein
MNGRLAFPQQTRTKPESMDRIENDGELREAIAEASWLLQLVSDYTGRQSRDDARLRFPRGFLRTAVQWRDTLSFIRKPTLRTNLSYQLMLGDVYLWLLTKTDLSGTARDMLVKAVMVHAGGMAEAMLVDFFDGKMGKRQRFTSRTKQLVADGLITPHLQAELNWLWDMRCRQHLFELDQTEFYAYDANHLTRAETAIEGLMKALRSNKS